MKPQDATRVEFLAVFYYFYPQSSLFDCLAAYSTKLDPV